MDAQVAAHLGELAALTAALCWSLNSLAFEAAGRRVGSLAVNYLRIFVAFPLLTLTAWLTRGLALPLDAPPQAWLWLSISGLVGFVFGDIFLFRAFVEIGSRISLLIRSLG
ncbi:MAG TPA: EamA family transporter, partial [Firmicutes bacterium]|nr:EamA family transporter [Bacillota bacterium]